MNKLVASMGVGVVIMGGMAAFALTQWADTEPTGEVAASGAGDARQATAVLERSATAYSQVAGFEDLMKIRILLPDGTTEKVDVPYAFGAGTDSSVGMPMLTAVSVGNTLYLTRDDIDDKYAELALKDDLPTTLDALFNGDANLPTAFGMRTRRGPQRYLASLGLGILGRPEISGYEKLADGTHQIALTARNGTARVRIDGGTHFLSGMDLEATVEEGSEAKLTAEVTFAPKVFASPSGLVKFESAGRRKVGSLRELQPTPIKVGDIAPDFTLETLDGESVTLSDLRGSVVVLDFWATWCRPCIMGMPFLDEFNQWAVSSELPIVVYAVDTFENGPADKVKAKAKQFWDSKGFSMPSLLDPDSRAVGRFGIQSIPTTYVIDPKGKVAKMHQGFDPKIAEILQRDVTELLGSD